MKERTNTSFKAKYIMFGQTQNLLKSFASTNSKGVDDITMCDLKKGGIQTIRIVKHIINLSIEKSKVPKVLKRSRISPLIKQWKPETAPLSYRPVNNVSSVAKLMNRHMFSQLTNYLESNNIIHQNHHGGRPHHSTTTAMLQIYNQMAEIRDQGDTAAALAIDLSAAYDLCDHQIMLDKLEHYGIRGEEWEWFRSYLEERQQCVQVGASRTELSKVPPCSVIQGGVGSGILYTVYTNDLPMVIPFNVTKELNLTGAETISKDDATINFVDDSTTIIRAKEARHLVSIIERYYVWLSEYFRANYMTINADKTAILVVSSHDREYIRNEMIIMAEQYVIKPLVVIKLLGYLLSNNLTHEQHLVTGKDSVLKKLNGRINVLKRLAKYTDKNTRRTIANAIFNGTITYLMPLWGHTDDILLAKLQTAQLRAARIIIGHPCFKMSTSEMLKKVQWMSVKQMILEKSSVIMHNVIRNGKPEMMGKLFECKKRDKRTRMEPKWERKDGFRPKTDFITKQFYSSALKFYNTIPQELRGLEKLEFKREIKKFIRETIPVKGQQFLE
jgi:hypothetical protein